MANVVEEFVAVLGWDVDSKELDKFNSQMSDVTSMAKKFIGVVVGATTAVAALVTVTNKQTAVQTNLARSFGISAEAAENWGFALSAIGLQGEAITRLMKDMSVRIGQAAAGIGSAQTIKDAAKAINLEFETLQKMKPEEQYMAILQAAKDTTDQSVAMAAAQQLGGRQASMIVGYLRTQKGTVEEILEAQARINVQTEEGRAGALRFFYAWDDIGNAITSIKALFSGLVGAGIAPFMEEFNEFVRSNRGLIRVEIKKWAEGFISAFKQIASVVRWVWDRIRGLIKSLGGLNKTIRLVISLFSTWLSLKTLSALGSMLQLTRNMTIAQALLAAKTGAVTLGFNVLKASAVGALALIAEDLYTLLTGGDSLIGLVSSKLEPVIGGFLENATRWFASFFGFTGQKYDILMQKLLTGFDRLPGIIKSKFTIIKTDLIILYRKLQKFFTDIGNSIVGFFSNVFQKAQQIVNKIKSLLPSGDLKKLLPFIGVPSPQMAQQGAQNLTSNLQNIANRVQNNNQITINQQPGQSSTDLANQVGKAIAEQSAQAVKNNASGVVY